MLQESWKTIFYYYQQYILKVWDTWKSNNSLWIAELWRYLKFFMKFQLNQVSLRILRIRGSIYDNTWGYLCFVYLEIKEKKGNHKTFKKMY